MQETQLGVVELQLLHSFLSPVRKIYCEAEQTKHVPSFVSTPAEQDVHVAPPKVLALQVAQFLGQLRQPRIFLYWFDLQVENNQNFNEGFVASFCS
jgi:hypothetical protein